MAGVLRSFISGQQSYSQRTGQIQARPACLIWAPPGDSWDFDLKTRFLLLGHADLKSSAQPGQAWMARTL